jgi:LmbE family N-acetylglucosaminyl deacetylase
MVERPFEGSNPSHSASLSSLLVERFSCFWAWRKSETPPNGPKHRWVELEEPSRVTWNPILRMRPYVRYLLMLIALPCVYMGGVCLALLWHEHEANADFTELHLPRMSAPTAQTRLLVFAPHPDDETLGCAGLIQQTLAAGGKVEVVILTNGDGFRTAVECDTHKMRVGPADFLRFASHRQQESLAALAKLGLSPKNVLFLGYPDQGLERLWLDFWTPEQLYTSPYTRADRVPYSKAFDPHAPYCGSKLLQIVEQVMCDFRPNLIAVTDPQEDHLDHRAASYFVSLALEELSCQQSTANWAGRALLVHYLVHRGDWPQPQGIGLTFPLIPPRGMLHIGTLWMSLPLTEVQERRKLEGIEAYRSQTMMMARFLTSFARRTELFGVLPTEALPQLAGHPQLTSAGNEARWWQRTPPVFLDAVGDNLLRTLEGGADLRSVCACRRGKTLCLDLEFCQPVSARYRYILQLRAFGEGGHSTASALRLKLPVANQALPGGGWVSVDGRHLEVVLPWRLLEQEAGNCPVTNISFGIKTYLARVLIDQSGMCLLSVKPASKDRAIAVLERG